MRSRYLGYRAGFAVLFVLTVLLSASCGDSHRHVADATAAAVAASGPAKREAIAATGAYERWDTARYNEALRRQHFDLTRDELIALAEQEYQRLERDMKAVARGIDPGRSWQQILERYQATHHPRTTADVIPTYEAEIKRAKVFMAKSNLVSFSFPTEVEVQQTPSHLTTNYPYVAYLWRDVLFVTVEVGGGPDEALRTHGSGLITTAVVHEVYPGHRIQNLASPGQQAAETFIEGWALYAEELMIRAGYYDDGPSELKLFAMRMLLYRAARAFLDAKIHRGDLRVEDAIDFLREQFNISTERARIEVVERYLKSPGSAATYLVGKRQIEQLRRQVELAEGSQFDLKRFHDRLLSRGGIPVQAIARQVFRTELAPAASSSAAPASPTLATEDLLARSRVLYGSLRSYADAGTVDVEFGPTGAVVRERHTFNTYYRAPRHFYFDFTKHLNADRFVVWGNDEGFHTWWRATGVESAYPRGQGTTAFVTGALPTRNALLQIAPLLFSGAGLAGTLTEFVDSSAAGSEVVNGRQCHRLTGVARSVYPATGRVTNERNTTVWIDVETLLVRKIFEDTPRGTPGGSINRVTTTFEPLLNPSVEDARFTFVPPTSQK